MTTADVRCFHCAEPVAGNGGLSVIFDAIRQPLCCAGCQAVAQLIIDSGQGDYYRYRDAVAARPDQTLLAHLSDWEAFDETAAGVVEGHAETLIALGGMHCAACGWLVERQLQRQSGVLLARADFQSRQVLVHWDPQKVRLSALLKCLVRLGYRPRPIERAADIAAVERKTTIRRLGVAGLGMMQVMMYATGTYFGTSAGMQPAEERGLQLVAFLLTSGVLWYAGQPFLAGAWRAVVTRTPNMDLPVAAALLLAYGASCFNLARGSGAVYFESVTMFVFFLLLGRFVEMSVRQRSVNLNEALGQLLPETALLAEGDSLRAVPRTSVRTGQILHTRVGDAFAADGRLLERTAVNEALLSGEAEPQDRLAGDTVRAGSINLGAPVNVQVTATGEELFVSQLERVMRSARAAKPRWSRLTERGAGYLVIGILGLAAVVYWYWRSRAGVDAFEAALAVLIVTCPCALSLAIPSVLAATTSALARRGLLVANSDALFALAQVDRALLDKTGTLTAGRMQVTGTRVAAAHPAPMTTGHLLAAVAAAERSVAHPIARAFDGFDEGLEVCQLKTLPGQGITAVVAGRRLRITRPTNANYSGTGLVVADPQGILAEVSLADAPRRELRGLTHALEASNVTPLIASGDGARTVADVAQRAGIDEFRAGQTPLQKLAWLKELQQQGHCVLAVGDGVNDAPLLAGADVSIAMASGTGLARSGADLVLTGELGAIGEAIGVSRRMLEIMRQNFIWALAYNAVAVPLAAAGLVPPWLAALGMSASSLAVVLNATRAARIPAGSAVQASLAQVPA